MPNLPHYNPFALPVFPTKQNPAEPLTYPVPLAPQQSHLALATGAMNLSPQEQALYQRHVTNLYGPGGVDNADGSRSTLYQATQEHNGQFYNIPTVWNGQIQTDKYTRPSDGRQFDVPNSTALSNVAAAGWNTFPSYSTPDAADARYSQMHQYLDQDTADYNQNRQANPMLTGLLALIGGK